MESGPWQEKYTLTDHVYIFGHQLREINGVMRFLGNLNAHSKLRFQQTDKPYLLIYNFKKICQELALTHRPCSSFPLSVPIFRIMADVSNVRGEPVFSVMAAGWFCEKFGCFGKVEDAKSVLLKKKTGFQPATILRRRIFTRMNCEIR